jgi:hypothetical protein
VVYGGARTLSHRDRSISHVGKGQIALT